VSFVYGYNGGISKLDSHHPVRCVRGDLKLFTWYLDSDSDGYGDPSGTTISSTQPSGYVSNNTDCNDSSVTEFPGQIWYEDADGDGYTSGATEVSCTKFGSTYYAESELIGTSVEIDPDDADFYVYYGQTRPVAVIVSPSDNSVFSGASTITFQGTGTDNEEGTLSGTSLIWTSDIDGQIGSGVTFGTELSIGTHIITLTATDSSGATGTAIVSVYVNDIIANSLGMTFNLIPAGTFTMGSPLDELGRYSDETQHEVTLTQSFFIQTTEVTQQQWYDVMGSNPSSFSGCSDCPVETVSWYDAQNFIETLNLSESGVTYSPYRLPTEAEWEYACRAGTTTAFYTGDITVTDCGLESNLNGMGWYCYNSGGEPHPVVQKVPNAWGLYDMYGNVSEWCFDWYESDLGSSAVTDPAGTFSGSERVVRGGFWGSFTQNCRSADRLWHDPSGVISGLGFRLVRNDTTLLPDTGQILSYTDTWGEDSDYLINPPSYADNGNGTVTDNVTGLMWQQEDDDIFRDWSSAVTYCENLPFGGHSDWYLPSRRELISIVDYGTYLPAIDEGFFPNTNSSLYWSSTTYASSTSNAHSVSFGTGSVNFRGKSNYAYVRCVRGGQETTASNFTDNGNGTVTDNITTLMWQQEDDDTTYTWEEALTYCEDTLTLAGYSDWRLPNIKELESIFDEGQFSPAINETYFPNTNSSRYWMSTTYASGTSYAWNVYFDNGYVNYNHLKSEYSYVRCVRGGLKLFTWYLDSDADGYGDPSGTTISSTQPSGYVSNNTDCNDSSVTEFPGQIWYEDADGDGYTSGATEINCEKYSDTYYAESELSGTSVEIDADDTDPYVWPGQTRPVAVIVSPSDSSRFSEVSTITFEGTGTDTEDGSLSGTSLMWTSDIDGLIGFGAAFTAELSIGTHIVTLTATDSSGATGTAFVSVYVYDIIVNSLGMIFNPIPAGTFIMGSPLDELGRFSGETEHVVTLTQSFFMQTTEVTQQQWYDVMDSNPSSFSGCSECPVENVSWNDAQDFIETLNQSESGVTDWPYRLPTEAEWEYTCRAGTTTAFYTGDIIQTGVTTVDPNLDEAGWYGYHYNTTREISGTTIVAQKVPNAWDLYDMHGNVYEWCSDRYGDYPTSPVTDPAGPDTGSYRILRGGCWGCTAQTCRSAFRTYAVPALEAYSVGFRLVRNDTNLLPDTGQTQSYTDTRGEDSDYTINPPSYTDNGNGTVTDNVTGLMWQQDDSGTTRDWSSAVTYCEILSLGGHSDWYLPSRRELMGIVDYGNYDPAIDGAYFLNTNSLYYWSSTTTASSASGAWSVDFYGGGVYAYDKSYYSHYVRCARGGQESIASNFTDNGDGTVTDNITTLMWQQGQSGKITWEASITYCETLSLSGCTDWRLPNIKELESIVDIESFSPAIDFTYFPSTGPDSYWSSTSSFASNPTTYAWDVSFSYGNIRNTTAKFNSSYARCVRGGQ
jgi:formylglycine-generating enzyme required for sulfatase activity